MKKALSYLLLFSYLVILAKPVLPYVSDFLAHAFWKYEHIATVHNENGKTHLHYDLQKAAKESGADKSTTNSKIETETTPHIIIITGYDFSLAQTSQKHFPVSIFSQRSITIAGKFPPPKA